MESIQSLVERAREVTVTPEQKKEQDISFVFGNVSFGNDRITKESVAEAYELAARAKPPL